MVRDYKLSPDADTACIKDLAEHTRTGKIELKMSLSQPGSEVRDRNQDETIKSSGAQDRNTCVSSVVLQEGQAVG